MTGPSTMPHTPHCGWRFFAAKAFNAATFSRDARTYSASMPFRTFASVDRTGCLDADPRALLQETVGRALPELMWAFGPDRYEPYRWSYGDDGAPGPFDARDLRVGLVRDVGGDVWHFVEQQLRADEVAPQAFGEALQVRYAVGDGGDLHVRASFNHALVDGIMAVRFLHAWEGELHRRGARLRELALRSGAARMDWTAGRTRFYVEDLHLGEEIPAGRDAVDYLTVLRRIVRDRPARRVFHVVASKQDARIQLALTRARRRRGEARFRSSNRAAIRRARRGNLFTYLLDHYRLNEARGDWIYGFMARRGALGRWLLTRIAGDVLVSEISVPHARFLTFPVVHPLQQEGIAVSGLWQEGVARVRLTGVRNAATGPAA